MSFSGSAQRIWRWSSNGIIRFLILLPLIALVWCVVLVWYVLFGVFLVPYRLIRRGQRRERRRQLEHAEMIDAIRQQPR